MLAVLQSAGFTPAILVHTIAALAAVLSGIGIFLARKGTDTHRLLGRSWAVLMLVVIVSSFFIRTSGSYSWIHLLSVGSLIALARAVYFVRKGDIRAHRYTMLGLYAGGLVLAGMFTLLPSRLLGSYLWQVLG